MDPLAAPAYAPDPPSPPPGSQRTETSTTSETVTYVARCPRCAADQPAHPDRDTAITAAIAHCPGATT